MPDVPFLYGRSGSLEGRSIAVPADGLTVGRKRTGNGRLSLEESDDISRDHCSIVYDPKARRFLVTDLGSTNGTFILPDERRVAPNEDVACRPGKQVRVGRDVVFDLTLREATPQSTGATTAGPTAAAIPPDRGVEPASGRRVEPGSRSWKETFSKDDFADLDSISLVNFVKGFPIYLRVLRSIVSHPLAFPQTISLDQPEEFRSSLKFLGYGLGLSFLLLLPVIVIKNEELSKTSYFVHMVFITAMIGSLLHVFLRIFGARGVDVRQTLTVYFYLAGVSLPLTYLLSLPTFLETGAASSVFPTLDDLQDVARQRALENSSGWYSVFSVAVQLVFSYIALVWFSVTHRISKTRVFFSFAGAAIVGGIVLVVVNPVFNQVFKWVDRVI